MNKYNEFYNILSSIKEYKHASYWKRIFSALIDAVLIYLAYLVGSFVMGFSQINLIIILFVSIFVFSNSYITAGRTVGEHFLKIKPIFITDIDKKTKNLNYIKRAFMKCVIFLPMGLSKVTIVLALVLVIGTLISLSNRRFRKNKVMLWDFATTMIVVEDGSSAPL